MKQDLLWGTEFSQDNLLRIKINMNIIGIYMYTKKNDCHRIKKCDIHKTLNRDINQPARKDYSARGSYWNKIKKNFPTFSYRSFWSISYREIVESIRK